MRPPRVGTGRLEECEPGRGTHTSPAYAGGIFAGVKSVTLFQDHQRALEICKVERCGERLRSIQHLQKRPRVTLARGCRQRQQLVFPEGGWDTIPPLPPEHHFGVHHRASRPAVAITEWLDLGNEEHHERRPFEWTFQGAERLQSLP